MLERGVNIERAVDHGISYGAYFTNPDGHRWEIFIERQRPGNTCIQAMRVTGAIAGPVDLAALLK